MMSCAFAAEAITLSVPFFRDAPGFTPGSEAWIGLKNTSTSNQVVTITYTAQADTGIPSDQVETFPLLANTALSWRPVITDNAEENEGSIVPNMTLEFSAGTISCCGSVKIEGSDTLSGRYKEFDTTNGGSFSHVLLYDQHPTP